MTKQNAKKRLAKLRQEIDHHRYLYHVKDREEISSAALDSLKHELTQLEEQYPELITPDSPSQRVGGQPLSVLPKVRHQVRMLSLVDAFSFAELKAWEDRNQKIVSHPYRYFVELKIDGVAASLVYQDGILVQAATRGDGEIGEEVTHNLRTVESVPLSLRRPLPGRVEIRGEVYLLKKDFDDLNQERKKQGQPLFANPRNIAAGSIRQLDPRLAAARPLRFFAWEITQGLSLKTREEEYRVLQDLGFSVPPAAQLYPNLSSLEKYLVQEGQRRARYPFLVDGLVIKINGLATFTRLGIVGKTPRGSIAYKFAAEEATTIVTNIVFQVGRTGALTPVAHLQPVSVAGTTVSRATLHNPAEIKRKDIRIGDTVIIHKAGDIIPEVIKSLPNLRPAGAKLVKPPSRCPVCGTAVVREADGAIYRCPNQTCFPIQRERLLHAVSDTGFDIAGLGEKIIEQLLQEGLLKDPPDLWRLTAGDLAPLARFAEKSAQKLVAEIQAHREISLPRFLVALSIPHVGVVTAQDLARELGTLKQIQEASPNTLASVSGIGDKMATAIADYLQTDKTRRLLAKYQEVGIRILPTKNKEPLSGRTFIFTGSLPNITRGEAKQIVIQLGGKVASAVGSGVDYVVVGEDPGSKATKAAKLGLKTLTPAEFIKMIRNRT